jgi:tetratricopeptide (TPR) repeat protein
MDDFAQLDLGFYCHDGQNQYRVEMVARAPNSSAELRPRSETHVVVKIDAGVLGGKALTAEYGEALADCLFTNRTVRDFFATARSVAANCGAPLRVRIRAEGDAGELHDLHWEKLRDPERPAFLCQDERILFSRYLSSEDWRDSHPSARGDLRVLVVVANPSSSTAIPLDPIDVGAELARARKGLEALADERPVPGTVSVKKLYRLPGSAEDPEWGGLPTFDNLVRELGNECEVLYLICHGELAGSAPRIYLETDSGEVDVRTPEEIAVPGGEPLPGLLTALRQLKTLPRLVILVVCESAGVGSQWSDASRPVLAALGPRLAEAGVPAVLAMQGRVTMSTMERFMPVFFTRLGRTGQIDAAVASARRQVSACEDWWSPALFMRLSDGCIGWRESEDDPDDRSGGHLPPLPKEEGPFVGREDVIAHLRDQIRYGTNPIVGLVGMGGVGKTALALRLAYTLQEDFPDGVLWTKLGTSQPEDVLIAIASACGKVDRLTPLRDLPSRAAFVRQILVGKKLLLVFDEATSSEQVKQLLSSDTSKRIVITSRNRKLLSNLGAAVIDVSPFSVQEGLALLSAELGTERVAAESDAAQQIIRYVEGLPLAVSIVAGWMRDSSERNLASYADQLQDETDRVDEIYDWEDASKNVRKTFEISYSLLGETFKRLFCSLALWDGPDFDSRAVAGANEIPLRQAQGGLDRLHSLSLVNTGLGERDTLVALQSAGIVRYRLHALLRSFARKQSEYSPGRLRRNLVKYYANLAHEHRHPDGYAFLDLDWQNIVVSLQWAFEQQMWEELVKGVLGLTHNYLGQMGFLDVRGRWSDARKILGWANEGAAVLGDPLIRARVFTNLGGFAVYDSDSVAGRSYLETSLGLLSGLEETPEVLLQKLYVEEFMHRSFLQSDCDAALRWLTEAIAHSRKSDADGVRHQRDFLQIQLAALQTRLGNTVEAIEAAIQVAKEGLALLPDEPSSARVSGLINIGVAYLTLGRREESNQYFEQAVPLAQALGDGRRLAAAWANMGLNERSAGHHRSSVNLMRQALAIYEHTGNAYNEAGLCINIGATSTRLGDDRQAEGYLVRALTLARFKALTDVEAMAESNLADLYLLTGRLSEATRALARAHRIAVELEDAWLLPTVLRQQAELALVEQDLTGADELIDDSLRLTQANGDQQEEGVGWRVKGKILNAQRRPDQALSAWRESLEILRGQDRYEFALTELTIVEAIADSGTSFVATPDELKTWTDEALESFSEIEAGRELERARQVSEKLFPTLS